MRSPGAGIVGLSETRERRTRRPVGRREHDLVHDRRTPPWPTRSVVRVLLPEARVSASRHTFGRFVAWPSGCPGPGRRTRSNSSVISARAASSSAGGSPGSGIVRSTGGPTGGVVRVAAGAAVGDGDRSWALLDGQPGSPVTSTTSSTSSRASWPCVGVGRQHRDAASVFDGVDRSVREGGLRRCSTARATTHPHRATVGPARDPERGVARRGLQSARRR